MRSLAAALTPGASENRSGWPTALKSVARFLETLKAVVPCSSSYRNTVNVHQFTTLSWRSSAVVKASLVEQQIDGAELLRAEASDGIGGL